MRFLPSGRAGLRLWLGLAAGTSLAGTATAQPTPRPTADALRRPAVATPLSRGAAPGHPRLDPALQQLAAQAAGLAARGAAPTATALRASHPQLRLRAGRAGEATVLVRITARSVAALLPALQRRGFEVSAAYPALHFVEGLLPVSELADASIDALVPGGLLGVLASLEPENNGGLVTSQADYALEAARARATRPRQLTGSGVTIGVMSDSFDYLKGAATNVASGDLPVVNVLSDDGTTDEGRAMCQLIYDLAPGSAQAFSTAYGGEGVFAQHIRDLADPAKGNCKVIVDDVRYFAEPFFQDGVVAQAVADVVTNRGVTYFSSAGNYADKSYENAAPQFVANAAGVRYLNFDVSGATTDVTQRVTVANGSTFRPLLQWSDPFYTTNGVKTDLDLFLVSIKNGATSDTVYRANSRNLLTQNPSEFLYFTNASATTGTTTFDLVIKLRTGPVPTRLKYVNYGSVAPSEWLTASSTATGHTSAAEGFAVAAVPYYNQKIAESFTSKGGPMTFLFGPTGTPLATPAVRQKPNLASVDGTNTTFFGSDYEGDGYPNFFGTSAAAPHAAAVAALLRASEPGLTPSQVYSRLVGSARLLGTTATDPLTGPGVVDAFTALYGGIVAATPPVVEDLEKGALPVSWNVNGYGAARATVGTQAPASGIQSLVLDAYPGITSVFSLNEATLFLQGVNASSLQLNFRTRKFVAETDEPMPASFTGRSNTDGVALSVDGGTTWYRVYDLTGTNSDVNFGLTRTVNLTQVAAANGLTLGNDVRLKFQQYGRGGSTATTVASRAGRVFDDIIVKANNRVPVALYTYSQPSMGCPGIQVQYADSSLFAPNNPAAPQTTYVWTFPGGTPATSTLRAPLVTYNTAGHFNVSLSVTTAAGTAARTDTGIVYIVGRRPAPTISASAAFVCRGSSITFGSTVATNCDAAYTYAWSFPGGTPATSSAANPGAVTYATAGTYTTTLTVSNRYGGTTVSVPVQVESRAPVPTITTTNPAICKGGTVTFGSTVLYCPGTYSWSFPGGTPATSSAANPGVVTYATAGNYTATLTVGNGYGSTTASVIIDVDGRALPFAEAFDAPALPRGWTLVTPTAAYAWTLVDGIVGRSGTPGQVIRAPFARDPNVGEKPSLYTPGINLTGVASPRLRFDLAYAPYSPTAGAVPTDIDSLTIHVVDMCSGTVLGNVYKKGAQGSLATRPSQPDDFIPTAADWRQEVVDLTPFVGKSVVLRFIGRNGYGNWLYMDNVQVGNNLLSLSPAAPAVGLDAWPNPTPSGTSLHLRLPAFTGHVDLRLVDNLGRVVWQQQLEQSGAALERSLSVPFATGLYNLLYVPAGGTPATRRIVLQ